MKCTDEKGGKSVLTNAVNGKKSKRSVKIFQTLALPYLQNKQSKERTITNF